MALTKEQITQLYEAEGKGEGAVETEEIANPKP